MGTPGASPIMSAGRRLENGHHRERTETHLFRTYLRHRDIRMFASPNDSRRCFHDSGLSTSISWPARIFDTHWTKNICALWKWKVSSGLRNCSGKHYSHSHGSTPMPQLGYSRRGGHIDKCPCSRHLAENTAVTEDVFQSYVRVLRLLCST